MRRGALGDTLLMVPALRLLRAASGGAALDFAGNLDHARVLQHYGVVDRALSSEDLCLWEGAPARARIARTWDACWIEGEHFDPRIAPACPRSAAEELLRRVARAAGWRGPLATAASLVAARPDDVREDLLVLAPGAGSRTKRAPLQRFVELARAARAAGHRVAVVLGEAELDDGHAAEVRRSLPEADEHWTSLGIVELAERLARAGRYVGNDSGVTHLAAALLVPTTALFVATDPAIWAPRGEHVTIEAAG